MERWLSPRDEKETRVCDSCGKYKMKAQFYNWYSHPALNRVIGSRLNGVICTPCAQREAGSRNWDKIKK